MINLLVGGDLVPTESNYEYFINADVEELIGEELKQIFDEYDYRVFNLEVPLTSKVSPICKWGDNLIASPETIHGIKELGADVLCLANNHILDQNKQGLESTIDILEKNNIAYVGAGMSLKDAQKPYVIQKDDLTVGIYCCVENEFSIATDLTAGANPFDPLTSTDHVNDMKSYCDKIIVLYHGGREHYPYPTPNLQKACRRFIEKGADIVICQHSHCVGCEEIYKGGTIIYGQGNFIFDYLDIDCWNSGMLIGLQISSEKINIEYIPIKRYNNKVRIADEIERMEQIKDFSWRSQRILDMKFLNTQFDRLASKHFALYMSGLKGYIPLQIEDYIKCETHRELIIRGLQLKERSLNTTIKRLYKGKKIIIWGTLNIGKRVYKELKSCGIEVLAFCDNDENKWGKSLYGLIIISPDQINKMSKENVWIQIASTYELEIESQILEMGFENYFMYTEFDIIKGF